MTYASKEKGRAKKVSLSRNVRGRGLRGVVAPVHLQDEGPVDRAVLAQQGREEPLADAAPTRDWSAIKDPAVSWRQTLANSQ